MYSIYFTKKSTILNRVVAPYSRVIRSKTYRGYVKPWIIPNVIYNVIFVKHTKTIHPAFQPVRMSYPKDPKCSK
jgi:hypothetical protein